VLSVLACRSWRAVLKGLLRYTILCLGGRSNHHLSDLFDPLKKDPLLPGAERRLIAWVEALQEGINGAPAPAVSLTELEIPNLFSINAIPLPGYGALIKDAAQGLDIMLDCAVKRVALTEDHVIVQTTNGTIHAEVAIVTFPLAILRKLSFDPPLPRRKQVALGSIGYGGNAVLNKVAVRLSSPLCPARWERLGCLPDLEEQHHPIVLWTNMDSVLHVPLMVGFFSGPDAARLDTSSSEKELILLGVKSLGRMFKKEASQVQGAKATRWLSDPWALGSYSFENGKSTTEDRLELSRPIEGRIYFAGEATHPTHYGTVHGALLSGQQVAIEIHKIYCCQGPYRPKTPWND